MTQFKTLVIHPTDRTTDFLDGIYKDKDDALVVRGDLKAGRVKELITNLDPQEVYMLGHGIPQGLIGAKKQGLVVDETFVNVLRGRDLVGIWCNADVYFMRYGLEGLFTGMFVSESGEARIFGLDTAYKPIEEGNHRFAKVVADVLHLRDKGIIRESEVEAAIRARYLQVHGLFQNHLKADSVLGYNADRIYYVPRTGLLPSSTLDLEQTQEEILFSWEDKFNVS